MAEYEPCFVYKPGDIEPPGRAQKRRKTTKPSHHVDSSNKVPFLPLFAGKEDVGFAQLRYEAFHAAWDPLERSLDTILREHHTNTINDISSFVENTKFESGDRKLPTALIVDAPNLSSQAGLSDAIARRLRDIEGSIVVSLTSTQLPNLKTALKYINRQAASQALDNEEENPAEGGRYLSYDLQMLQDHVKTHSAQKVVLYFHDGEGFQEALLSDLIEIFSSWNDRIPFILLFGIATSIDLFQEKLSQATLRLLQGSQFQINQLDVETLFNAIMSPNCPSHLWFGAGLSRVALQRHRDHVQTNTDFIRTIKYVYMTHFFSDPLSILTRVLGDLSTQEPTPQHVHCQAIRTLPSFKRYAAELLHGGDVDAVRSLLDDDQVLLELVIPRLKETQKAFTSLMRGIENLESVQSYLSLKQSASWSDLYVKAMSGELNDSTLVRETLLAVKKMASDIMQEMLGLLSNRIPSVKKIHEDLCKLISTTVNESAPLRSEHDVHHKTLRTTVVAQKVELSKQTAALSKQDIEYSKIVNAVDTVLREYFEQTFVNPQDLFLNEVFLYDAKSPYRDAFTPRPRFAVERALSSPHDYLGCTCCDNAETGLSSTQPATAVLYQLYLESGSLINVSDLWSAFNTIVGNEEGQEEEDQQKTLGLFSRALAELKYLGMIKSSRKKADHLAKLSWKGL